jgi:hypothetical protein
MITKITMFSLIKFFCILAGFTTGTFIVLHHIPALNDAFNAAQLQENRTPSEAIIYGLLGSLFFLSWSFLISAIYYKADALYSRIMASSRFSYLNSVLMYMIRYTDHARNRGLEGVSNTAFAAPPHVTPDSTSTGRAA